VRFLLPVVLAAALLGAGAAALAARAGGGPGQEDPAQGYGKDVRYARAVKFCDVFRAEARLRRCLIDGLLQVIVASHDPADELPRIDAYVGTAGGFLQANCHVLMHSVGRRYGREAQVTLARLRDYLPRTNNANCSAGFAHGLLTYLAPQLGVLTPTKAAAVCDAAKTRYQRYSCIHGFGHAYMRLYSEQLPYALRSCRLLGPQNAPDCAAGAFHDYWIAVSGLDDTHRPADTILSPRLLCTKDAGGFVRGCWYRALLERPPAQPVKTAAGVLRVCNGLSGVQRSGCVTAAAVVSADDPFAQMQLCASLRDGDALDCVRGVRAPDLGKSPLSEQVRLIRQCALVAHVSQAGCYTWLGKALNVVADGRFAKAGCADLSYSATRARCRSGAAAYEGPLETFS
jgi:hypothetical protein